jgi:hypothetical protein
MPHINTNPVQAAKQHFHHDYNYAGAVERAIKGDSIDSTDVPAAALKKIGDWTDTTWGYFKAFVGKDTLFVHVDDELAADGKMEGFLAANSTGHIVAQGSFDTDDQGNYVPGSIQLDK